MTNFKRVLGGGEVEGVGGTARQGVFRAYSWFYRHPGKIAKLISEKEKPWMNEWEAFPETGKALLKMRLQLSTIRNRLRIDLPNLRLPFSFTCLFSRCM